MKIIKILYRSIILSIIILVMGSVDARDVISSETGSTFSGHSLSSIVEGSELLAAKATAIIGDAFTLPPFLSEPDAVHYSPLKVSPHLDGNKNDEEVSRGDVSRGPEPGILLVLGSVLMGIALYRRYRYK